MGNGRLTAAVCLAIAASTAPLGAETPTELDALARATAQPASGIALARRQIGAGDLLDALATLERVIINSPQNDEARLLHAGLLCRLDDRRGANVELDTLRGRPVPDALWAEVSMACSGRQER